MLPIAVGCILLFAGAHSAAFENWVARRDAGVIRQERDFSCGTAALATLLSHYYLMPTSELELLRTLAAAEEGGGLDNGGISLQMLARLARDRGLAARGVAVTAAALDALRVPAIAYLERWGQPHFAVLRGVSPSAVELADPARGNLRVTREAFAEQFLGVDGRGRLLLLAAPAGAPVARGYFGMRRPLPLLQPPG